MPTFVVDDLRSYLRCGVPALGAVRFACEHCGAERLVGGRVLHILSAAMARFDVDAPDALFTRVDD